MKYLFTILLAGMTFFTYAQQGNGKMMTKNSFTPQQMAELQTKKMVLALDLTSAQESKVLAYNQKMAAQRKAMMQKRKTMKESGKTLSSEERFKMQKEMLDRQIKNQAEMKKILNKEQYEQWKNMRAKMAKSKHGKKMNNCSHRSGRKMRSRS